MKLKYTLYIYIYVINMKLYIMYKHNEQKKKIEEI